MAPGMEVIPVLRGKRVDWLELETGMGMAESWRPT